MISYRHTTRLRVYNIICNTKTSHYYSGTKRFQVTEVLLRVRLHNTWINPGVLLANLGFFEAVSDAIGLSVFTPQHFSKLGLHNSTDDYGSSINFLMLMALRKVAYMPFAYIVDEVLHVSFIIITITLTLLYTFPSNINSGGGASSATVSLI